MQYTPQIMPTISRYVVFGWGLVSDFTRPIYNLLLHLIQDFSSASGQSWRLELCAYFMRYNVPKGPFDPSEKVSSAIHYDVMT